MKTLAPQDNALSLPLEISAPKAVVAGRFELLVRTRVRAKTFKVRRYFLWGQQSDFPEECQDWG